MAERGFDFHQATVYKIEAGSRRVPIEEAVALADIVAMPLTALVANPRMQQGQYDLVREGHDHVQNLAEVVNATRRARASVMDLELYARRWDQAHPGEHFADGKSASDFVEPLTTIDLDGVYDRVAFVRTDAEFYRVASLMGLNLADWLEDFGED